jgi:hypothetical protein
MKLAYERYLGFSIIPRVLLKRMGNRTRYLIGNWTRYLSGELLTRFFHSILEECPIFRGRLVACDQPARGSSSH